MTILSPATLRLSLLVLVLMGGCAPDPAGDPEPPLGPNELDGAGAVAAGSRLQVCNVQEGLNLRSGPGTEYMVLHVLPPGTLVTVTGSSGHWLRLDAGEGRLGYGISVFLCPAETREISSGALTRQGVLDTCAAYLGYSYWWGGAALPDPFDDPASKEKGSCSWLGGGGHTGRYGADCSGYVAKVWQLPAALPFPANRHPYSTYDFRHGAAGWQGISWEELEPADALVTRDSDSGHIVVHGGWSLWRVLWSYEARSCLLGIVRNLRYVGSSYKPIRRNGIHP